MITGYRITKKQVDIETEWNLKVDNVYIKAFEDW